METICEGDNEDCAAIEELAADGAFCGTESELELEHSR